MKAAYIVQLGDLAANVAFSDKAVLKRTAGKGAPQQLSFFDTPISQLTGYNANAAKERVAAARGRQATAALNGLSDFVGAMENMANATKAVGRSVVHETSAQTASRIMSETKRYVPDFRLSGTTTNALLSVQIKPFSNYKYYLNSVEGSGPWALIDKDTPPHIIRPKNAKALKLGPNTYRAKVYHPGTKGKHIWRDATKEARRALVKNGLYGGAQLANAWASKGRFQRAGAQARTLGMPMSPGTLATTPFISGLGSSGPSWFEIGRDVVDIYRGSEKPLIAA